MIPVRWRPGDPRLTREFPALAADHPLSGTPCPCGEPLYGGEPIALVYVGPGPDDEDRERAARGGTHTGIGVAVHMRCVYDDRPEDQRFPV